MVLNKKHVFLLGCLMLFPRFAKAEKPEINFWKWFSAHEKELYDWEKDQNRIFDSLSRALRKVGSNLTFEFGPKNHPRGKREFVISAGGMQASFPKVESLWAAAPKLDRWVFTKFRPRRLSLNDLEIGGKSFKADAVKFLPFRDAFLNKVGIMIFLPGYQTAAKDDAFQQAGYLFLDHALGEFDVETRVGTIVFEEERSPNFSKAISLSKLPQAFDEYFKKGR